MKAIQEFWNNEQGQDLIEYTLLMAFVALASAALFLGAGGSINPLTQPVTPQVGSYSVTLPPGSFKQLGQGSKAGNYVYSGTMNGVSLQVHIVALGNSSYVFKAAAQPVNPTGLSNPVAVTITISNHSGTAGAAG